MVIPDDSDDPSINTTVDGYDVTSVLSFINPLRTDEAVYECRGVNNVVNIINTQESDTSTLYVQGMYNKNYTL